MAALMRQHWGLSKADLVEWRRLSATGSDQMAPFGAITSREADENIVESGFARYIVCCEFRRSGNARRRWDARPRDRQIAAAPGEAIG
jgi:hypothetical protein